jgi:hypothetical protein
LAQLGFAMIESVRIQNFRCFAELEVHGLSLVNVIVGENASGKSAFLESVYLSCGAFPQAVFQFRAARQLSYPLELRPDSTSYWGLWEDLFHGYDLAKPISIEAVDPGGSRTLKISRSLDSSQTISMGAQLIPLQAFAPVMFDWTRGDSEPVRVTPRIKDKALIIEGGPREYFPISFSGPHIPDTPQDNAIRFSELSKDGKIQPVIDALRAEFPFLRTLSIEISSGVPTVFAEVQGQNHKLPVGLISDGVNKLLSLLIAIGSNPNGIVLIDQIEDGFYFKKMVSTWKVIHKFARENRTQIFATTHSQECLAALLPELEANEEDFALLRASRSDDSIRFSVNNGKRFAAALSQEFELR